ncbi:ABC-2 transporter permease [Staphylococcus saccharolyticus]|uniref:Membrane protein n=1 Tax=Staphylococcus saccharolyticus TaxID=33028 RepID=A0A380HB90_9STAP|nr:ABC-2 transporter permease [Staphylococcus saccharolyticus]MBL7564440.1 ABC-2 transporter permease [Staphylococcus saccharolyticus]MBL7571296.1 ABC-2 transporter permease [Staphylococcus saccharolyticus]QQB99129.1 ABC-2 transporter permease [Staphylococcus saccharolyticus]QRJ66657.1 ABC-2 transporter permease [Staphylococcus saccharolyticus]RTX94577.1 ABC-2 transporter permease [Staphylococcus saccharolyticus]
MKGLILSIFYSAKRSFFIYLIVGIIAAIVFSFLNPTMNSFLAIIFLIGPITDNFNREKDSRCMNYISTLPVKRADYVKSYYMIFIMCLIIGIVVGVPSVGIITQSLSMVFISLCVGIGSAGTYSIMFPLTFKFGSDNSNVIVMSTTFAVIIIYFVFYISSMIFTNNYSDSFASMLSNTQSYMIYGIFGLISLMSSFILSIKIFNKQKL